MKRFTMTPMSRKSIKVPSSVLRSAPYPRQSIMSEEVKRRDVKSLRDKSYKQSCIDKVLSFLLTNNCDTVTQKILQSPSSKEFQFIFKFIYSFIEHYEYTYKFEDDLINLLKLIRYPFSGEITKSQLSAITPQNWPIILSMLSWMVDLVMCSVDIDEEDNKNIESLFLEYVCCGYIQFMQGNEDDTALEEEFEKQVMSLYTEMDEEIAKLNKCFSELQEHLCELQSKSSDFKELVEKKNLLVEDLNSLVKTEQQLNSKRQKYIDAINKLSNEMSSYEIEVSELRKQHNSLADEISQQKINPDALKEMNFEKVGLFNDLEKIKPEKELMLKEINDLEKKIQEKIDELDKYSCDIRNLRSDIKFNFIKDSKGFITMDMDALGILEMLEEETNSKKEFIVKEEINRNSMEEDRVRYGSLFRDLEEQYKERNNKLLTTGQLYVQKKENSDSEQRKSKSEMERLENDLLRLNLESHTTLRISDQELQSAKIKLAKTVNQINYERDRVGKIMYGFYSSMEELTETLKTQVGELQKLRDQMINDRK